jgi:hypothetical protein
MSIADNVAISVVLLGIALLLVWLAFRTASLAERDRMLVRQWTPIHSRASVAE